jgi:anaerobic magnesium-protoporphyrin IX monomethyl ester cyclase
MIRVCHMKARVLFIYPTPFRVTGLPVGIASLIAVLKQAGHSVKVFDTALYRHEDDKSQAAIRAERMISKEVRDEDGYLPEKDTLPESDLLALIDTYKPDIIGFSILEIMYADSTRLAVLIKKTYPDIPILAGGVFPTLSPEIVIQNSSFDIICVGEGETALLNLANRIAANEPYNNIESLWVKQEGIVTKNEPTPLHDINTLPFPDFSEFGNHLFYKPMQGKMYRMINIESSRGCINNCTYCAAPQLRKFFRDHNCGKYFRNMAMEKVIEQIQKAVQKYSPEFIYFSSENFLSMSDQDFATFINAYDKIRLPFWIQTRIETLNQGRINDLKRVGMLWLTIGLEHGNEEFRRKVLKRHYSNENFMSKMRILKEAGIGASINNVIGFPDETRELMLDTVRMNKLLYDENPLLETNVFLFTPYRGCELFGTCQEKGLIEENAAVASSHMNERSVLNFPEEKQRDLTGLIRTFNLYIRLPESCADHIKIAESPTAKGDAMLKKLTTESIKRNAGKSGC